MKKIATIYTDFPTKFGIPRQGNLIEELKGKIVFEEAYRNREAFRGLEDFSHIWLLWEFSENQREGWSPTVRPPKLGGNVRKGVFATRSPFRPNSIGLSCVKLEKIEFTKEQGPVLHVAGADLMNGTPIYDIKPYLPYVDSIPDAANGFTERTKDQKLFVEFPEEMWEKVPEGKMEALVKVLELDPRPGYQKEESRIYGFGFAGTEVKFMVEEEKRIKVVSIETIEEE
ncbi:MAG: tRNA (N6-threonylcarbamoyladenosine(37)-N6)-methyltransferase TrmO [Eubacterium sp.]|nr:tRNA (N6-threonylcarbamoyladenosine(37)-N6)-methyltransferase TrmO [Eubacterium sp.]